LQAEDFDSALDDVNWAIELEPEAKYYVQRGILHREVGDRIGAIADFERAIELDPDNPALLTDLATEYFHNAEIIESIDLTTLALSVDPDNSGALAIRSLALKELGDPHAALVDGLRAYELDPGNWQMAENIAELYAWHIYDFEEGIKYLTIAIDQFPNEAWRYADRSIMFRALDDGESSLADMDRAIELDPDTAWYYTQKGITLRDNFEDIEGALFNFETAIELDPQEPTSFDERAQTFAYYLEDYGAAIDEINRAIEIDPTDPWRYQFRAGQFQNLGDLDAAHADFLQATELDSDDAWPYIDLGYFYFDVLGDVDSAFDAWNIAAELDPENPDVYHARYLYYADVLGDPEAAIDDLNRCLRLSPEHPWCHWERAWLYEEIDEVELAIRDFEAFLETIDEEECPECVQDAIDYIESK
jgi:tetratricopeptide (TPR) repeat protein